MSKASTKTKAKVKTKAKAKAKKPSAAAAKNQSTRQKAKDAVKGGPKSVKKDKRVGMGRGQKG
jgi:hypothetical protein